MNLYLVIKIEGATGADINELADGAGLSSRLGDRLGNLLSAEKTIVNSIAEVTEGNAIISSITDAGAHIVNITAEKGLDTLDGTAGYTILSDHTFEISESVKLAEAQKKLIETLYGKEHLFHVTNPLSRALRHH